MVLELLVFQMGMAIIIIVMYLYLSLKERLIIEVNCKLTSVIIYSKENIGY